MTIGVRPLGDDLPFGARVTGVTEAALKDAEVRRQINAVFEDRGMILFEDVEPTSRMQVDISTVFGPLKEHPVKLVDRVDGDALPGVIVISNGPDRAVVEVGGETLATWQPWHFDHCYNDELNRAGVLRAVAIAPEGGLTGFADGVQIYEAISPELRAAFEDATIIYTLDLLYSHMRFGNAPDFRPIREHDSDILAVARTMPRALHPAVWTRATGQKVLHVSPWMAVGVAGQEDPAGDELFEALCQEIVAKLQPYYHRWRPRDMIVWDNWRMLHKACGCPPEQDRVMHRTTIRGDYGLGRFESEPREAVKMDVM